MANKAETRYNSKRISAANINLLYSLSSEGENGVVTLPILQKLFAYTKKQDPLFQPNDYFLMKAGTLYNKNDVETTAGRFIFNKVVISEKVGNIIGYQNYEMGDDGVGKLDKIMSNLLLFDKITSSDMATYLDRLTWLGYSTARFLNPSLNTEMVIPDKSVTQVRDDTADDMIKAAENGDLDYINKKTNEMLEVGKRSVKDKPGYEIFSSGARGSFKNNWKNVNLSRGIIPDFIDPSKYNYSKYNLYEGIPAEEQDIYANIGVSGSNSRAIATQNGGYTAKKLSAAYQGVKVAPRHSDCGTSQTLPVTITQPGMFIGRYIVENGKMILLDESNIDKYKGRKVMMRSPLFCRNKMSDGFCNYCIGDTPYNVGYENVGLASAAKVGNRLVSLSLKAFHDSTVNVKDIDIDDYII